ncbi:Fam3b [Symbiodinium necroappetens]|uniref:Fam3b protein n=1 Tax=Symbiodinium necroappetens TaxID=1628268 RepID=A0A812UPS4_9DINO|nr:Fam3b [Symbiodinium necroappetens]
MLQLSSKLPLMEAAATPGGVPFAFASGLAVHNNTVVITYGAGHRDVRALVMTLDRLDEMFACSVYVNE